MILKVDPDVLSLNEKYLNNQKKTVIFLKPSITNKITPKKFNCLNWKLTDGRYRTDQPWYQRTYLGLKPSDLGLNGPN